ncbi:hypothetical protein [Algoriphagus aquimarinus]|uniref:hypothetical protein n=1 Tax=Algoriphagus aquimarinus TaxID=237018 RepID=UPI0030D840C2|tara:strand:+ start:43940 stop:44977 length:1038 start_codon:yes stop_codon:yes gene_type:complete
MDASITIVTIVYIVILIVPGVFFKRFYFQGPFHRQFQSGLFADRFITSLFWGIVTQIMTFYIFINTFDVEYSSVYELLTRTHEELRENKMPLIEKATLTNTLLYLLSSVLVAIFLGQMAFRFVRLIKLDLYTNVLRFSNKWHYYFSGEILKTKEFKKGGTKQKGEVIATLVDVLVNYGDGDDRLFSGNLVQYTINSTGNLETLYLAGARRYSNSRGENIPAKEIPGDCFVIPYQNVLNMNVQYILRKIENGKKRESIKKGSTIGIQVFIFILFVTLFIFPWYTSASILSKIVSIVSFVISWFSLVILLGNWMGTKKLFGVKGMLLLIGICGLFTGIGLWFLDYIF